MTINESSQTAALTGYALQSNTKSTQHILVLEDDACICKLNNEMLKESSYQVNAAEGRVVRLAGPARNQSTPNITIC